ncbi:MAG: hypothetical protein JWP11_2834 [Frankiales bacterium]|nr:hypothetical protein [Frankiales bacterium]
MSEPTVQLWEGAQPIEVSALPGWHEHPECVFDNGKPLAHMHSLSKQPPHTHRPVKAWGDAVPPTGSQQGGAGG